MSRNPRIAAVVSVFQSPTDPLILRVVLNDGDCGIWELDLGRHEYGEPADEVPNDWIILVERGE